VQLERWKRTFLASAFTSYSLTGGPPAIIAVSSFRVWLRASLRDISPPMRRWFHFLVLHPIDESINCLPVDEVFR
jgi:hypothetical protein